jgi:hypothetical protein
MNIFYIIQIFVIGYLAYRVETLHREVGDLQDMLIKPEPQGDQEADL